MNDQQFTIKNHLFHSFINFYFAEDYADYFSDFDCIIHCTFKSYHIMSYTEAYKYSHLP